MAKEKKEPNRLQAVCVVRSTDLLCKSYSLTIVDGQVVDAQELTRADDMPNVAIGHAQRMLWSQYRQNRGTPK